VSRGGARPSVYVGVVTSGWSRAERDLLIEDVLVDAHGDSEQLGAFECAFEGCGPQPLPR